MISFLADWLIVIIYSDAYIDSIPVLKVLIWVNVPIFLNPYLSHILFARGEQRKALLVAALSLLFYIPIIFWFISQWGAIGAAWAFLTALSIAFGLYFVLVLGIKAAVHTLLNFGQIALAAAGSTVFIMALKDIHPVPLLGSALVIYALLLLLFRVPSSRDLEFIREMASRGLRQVGKIRGRICF